MKRRRVWIAEAELAKPHGIPIGCVREIPHWVEFVEVPKPDPLRMWALVGWYAVLMLGVAAFMACWGWA
jgi:hypothetical protein